MAVIHSAYLFDPITFHRRLREKVIRENRLDEQAMQGVAKEAVENASAATRHALRFLRFDPEWLDWPDPEVSHLDKWYVICLAGALTLAPSLTNRCPVSWRVLREGLPAISWTASEIKQLVEGNPLPSLIKTSELTKWLGEISPFLSPYGGWLRASEAKGLESRLLESRDQLLNPSSQPGKALLELAGLLSESARELLQKAYADATDMLQASVESNKALLVILD